MSDDVIVHTRAAGIDVSKTDAKVCVRIQEEGKTRAKTETRVFKSTGQAIKDMRAWLEESQVTSVLMESTSVYWWPFFYGLEDAVFEVHVANAAQVKQMRGRKSDIADATHLARLAALGMIRDSFIPPTQIRDLRLLTRTRKRLVHQASDVAVMLEKMLEDTGLKLSSVASKLLTKSGIAILEAIAAGQTDAEKLASLSQLRVDHATLVEALDANIRDVHRALIRVQLDLITHINDQIAVIDQAITTRLEPYRRQIDLITSIPGFSTTLASVVIAETGGDMSVFATPGNLAAWAGVAPGINESAGKNKSAKCKPGNRHLKAALTIAAMSLITMPTTSFHARYKRICTRHGHRKALIAVARSLIVTIWHALATGRPYHERGPDYFQRPLTTTQRRRRIATAEATLTSLGVDYTINTPI